MAKLVFGMNVSLDGYVDHDRFSTGPKLFRHWAAQARAAAGSIYGRRMYELMRYWDEDDPQWRAGRDDGRSADDALSEADLVAYATAWRAIPKWVVSSELKEVGPNATLIDGDFEATARRLKASIDGEVGVSGTRLAHGFGALGLIDEYVLYLHPIVLGSGVPFFAGPRPPLRLVSSDRMDEDVMRLAYVPA